MYTNTVDGWNPNNHRLDGAKTLWIMVDKLPVPQLVQYHSFGNGDYILRKMYPTTVDGWNPVNSPVEGQVVEIDHYS